MSDSPSRPYQVVFYVGSTPMTTDRLRVVDLTPRDGYEEVPVALQEDRVVTHPMLDALAAAGVSPADMRSRVLFVVDPATAAADAVSAYSIACAFANRRLDVASADRRLNGQELDEKAALLPEVDRLEDPPEWVQAGALNADIPSLTLDGQLSSEQLQLIRYGRRLRFVATGDPLASLAQFLVVCSLRKRASQDRFPVLSEADAPLPEVRLSENGDFEELILESGVDLDALRLAAMELRRTRRHDDRSHLADVIPLTSRQLYLMEAAAIPVEDTLRALGSTTPDGESWHCPRPDRHTNGDAVPSMKIQENLARCFRCDRERVDSLRLVMDTKDLSASEAAAWLVSTVSPASVAVSSLHVPTA